MSQTLQTEVNEPPIRAAMRALMVRQCVEALDGLHYCSFLEALPLGVRVEASVRPVMPKETTEQYVVVLSLIYGQPRIRQRSQHRRH